MRADCDNATTRIKPIAFAGHSCLSRFPSCVGCFISRNKLAGCQVYILFEDAVEVGEVIKTGLVAGVEDMTGFMESPAGEIDTRLVQVVVEGRSRALLEQLGEPAR